MDEVKEGSDESSGQHDDVASEYVVVAETGRGKRSMVGKEEHPHDQRHSASKHMKRRSVNSSSSSSKGGQHSNLSKVIKGEIHNILSVLRSDPRYASPSRFQMELLPSLHHEHPSSYYSLDGSSPATAVPPSPLKTARNVVGVNEEEEELSQHPLINSLHALNDMLTEGEEGTEINVVTYISPFATAASSREISASITGAALEALHKFILYGFITPASSNAKEGITIIARSIRHCTFEAEMSPSATSSSSASSNAKSNEEEVVVLKLLSLAVQVIRCSAGILLNANDIVGIFDTCWHVILKAKHASDLLKSAAGDALGHIVLVVFSRATNNSATITASSEQPAIVTILSRLTTYLNPLVHPTSTNVLSLTLLNIALETCTVTTFTSLTAAYPQLLTILQNDLCKHLLCLSTTEDLVLLTLTLRVIFNLFHGVNKDFLKVQLEVFLTSVHLRILLHNTNDPSSSSTTITSTSGILEQREIALESLVEFCHEPALMMDIYLNYDCDLNCTNLFESICRALSFCAIGSKNASDLLNTSLHGEATKNANHTPAEGKITTKQNGVDDDQNLDEEYQLHQQPLNALNRLALEGILAVIDSIARRCIIGPRTATGPTVTIATTNEEEIDDEDENSYTNESDKDFIATSQSDKQRRHYNDWERVRLLRKKSSLCSSTDGEEEDEEDTDGNVSDDVDQFISNTSSLDYNDMESLSSIDCDDTPTPQKQKHHHHLWHSPKSRERTAHILRKRKQRKQKTYLIAREFNRSSSGKEWISTGERLNVLPTPATPQSVASFLYHSHTLLDKTKIGLYVSKGPDTKYPFHAQVRKEYVNLFDFRTMSFSGALRYFLKRFRLPGEAQCIDRLMEAFANRLYEQQSLKDEEEEEDGHKKENTSEELVEEKEDKKKDEENDESGDPRKGNDNQTKKDDTEESNAEDDSPSDEAAGVTDEEEEREQYHGQDEDKLSSSLVHDTTNVDSEIDNNDKKDNKSTTDKKSSSSPFHDADAVFILAFSTIMLNTDLHNPNMKDEKRMTVEQFIRNNRGINRGEDLPQSFLSDLYHQIKHKEIQVQSNTTDHVFSEVVATTATASTGIGDGDGHSASEAETTGGTREKVGSSTADAAWDGILSKYNEVETAFFTPSDKARRTFFRAGLHERDMFTSIVSMSIQCISSIFVRSWDDLLVVKALRGFREMAEICVYFNLEEIFNEILEILLGYGRDYAMSTIALEGKVGCSTASSSDNHHSDGVDSSAGNERKEMIHHAKDGEESDDEEALFDEIPNAVLARDAASTSASTSSPSHFRDTVTGSASHRGLLSLNCALTLIRLHPARVREAWPSLVSCVFALRDADALPVGLADLDDFADSRGVVLSSSPFARLSRRRVDAYIASLLTVEESDEGSSWFWRSLFGRQKKGRSSSYHAGSGAGGSNSLSSTMKQNTRQSSPLTEALISVAESAEIDQILIRSRDLPLATQIIHVLLDAMDPTSYGAFPFPSSSPNQPNDDSEGSGSDSSVADLLFEHHAVFALELAARALLSNRQCAPALYPMFLSKFESILAADNGNEQEHQQQQRESSPLSSNGSKEEVSPKLHPSSAALRAPYVMERVVVTILRSCIHLYDIPEMRQHLRFSLQLLAGLPMEFLRHISDRLACGMAIILRGRFCQLETADEWNLVGDLLDRAARFRAGRRFVFDGIASSVDYALLPPSEDSSNDNNSTDAGDNSVSITYEGGYILAKMLTYFVLGTYDGDISMRLLAMTRLEKMYWILFHMSTDHSAFDEHNKPMENMVPDEELWQIVASAFHECSLSEDAETSRQGIECYERFLLTTKPASVSDVGWIAVMYNLSSRQPSVEADGIRVKSCALLGKILLLMLPKLSQRKENWEILTTIVKHTADVIGTNLRAGRRGNVSPLFESTVQTVTNMCNVMALPEFDNGAGFSQWAGEILLAELEKVGASGGAVVMVAATTRQSVVDV